MTICGIAISKCISSYFAATDWLSQFPDCSALWKSSKTISYHIGIIPTVLQLPSIKQCLEIALEFWSTTWTGYMTKQPSFTIVAVFSEFVWKLPRPFFPRLICYRSRKLWRFLTPGRLRFNIIKNLENNLKLKQCSELDVVHCFTISLVDQWWFCLIPTRIAIFGNTEKVLPVEKRLHKREPEIQRATLINWIPLYRSHPLSDVPMGSHLLSGCQVLSGQLRSNVGCPRHWQ